MAALGGCDRGSPELLSDTGPDVNVVAVAPAPESTNVPLAQTVRAQLDRYPSPLAFLRQTACFRSFAPDVAGCIGSEVQPEVDPVDRIGTWRVPSLAPDLRYEAEILAPGDAASVGVRAFDGAPLAASVAFGFHTGLGGAPSAEPTRPGDYCTRVGCTLPSDGCTAAANSVLTTPAARDVLAGCAGSTGCHAKNDTSGRGGSRLVLDPRAIANVIGKVALAVADLPDPRSVDRSGTHFPIGMPYVDPGNPANSYLLYVMILALPDEESTSARGHYARDVYACDAIPKPAAPSGTCTAPAPTPTAAPLARAGDAIAPAAEAWLTASERRPIADGERTRLARRIPTDESQHVGRVSWDDARAVEAWIAAGASTTCSQ